MKKSHLIMGVVIAGLLALFFFPEPENHFLAYVGTAVIFLALSLFLVFKN